MFISYKNILVGTSLCVFLTDSLTLQGSAEYVTWTPRPTGDMGVMSTLLRPQSPRRAGTLQLSSPSNGHFSSSVPLMTAILVTWS